MTPDPDVRTDLAAQFHPRGLRPVTEARTRLDSRREGLAYLVVGAWNTVFAYTVWAVLQLLLGDRLHYLVVLVLAWPIAVANAYVCHRRFVFRSHGSIRRELPRFSVVYILTLMASLVLLPVLLQTLPFNIFIVQAGFTAAVVALSYLAHKFVSFRQDAPPHGTSDG